MKFWLCLGLCCLLSLFSQAQYMTLLKKNVSASVYAKRFEGRKTANGERFCHDSLTCAHKRLPFGQLVMVQNLENDCTVVVRVNDRMSKRSRHSIDLTRAGARKIGIDKNGIGRVRIWHYFPPPVQEEPSPQ